ncbi:S8 family serine peptidase [Lentzea sp. NPDC005914]|uniref:S8 family serine peptidase n=1 Tax=Lentzea sp. NPDC005914 TaxID=3154572 RepID=UPI0033C86E22
MRRFVAAFSAIALLALPSPAQASPSPGTPRQQTDVITLITGDTVFVHGADVEVKAADGREKVEFVRLTEDGDAFVFPADTVDDVASGRVDRRLFNVTELVREGFAGRPLPLIVSHDGPRIMGGRYLSSINATAVTASEAIFAASSVKKIWLDANARLIDDESNDQIGAPAAWRAGFTGKGVTVADLDSGYDPAHPDFQGVVVGHKDFLTDGGASVDQHGHGSHTASIIAGSGAASAGKYRGVAPDAKLLVGKVCDASGSCPNSAIIEGMEWAASNGARVVNLSLGGGATDGTDPMSQAVNSLTAQTGTLFVIAAGNSGAAGTVASPGAADAALTVGSVTKADALSSFSSRGPRVGDGAIKPDIAAPGSAIVAARAAGTSMGTPVDANYTTASGTSMATPHVTGAAAVLAQQHPEWKASQLKAALMAASKPLNLSVYAQGAGRLDVGKAVNATLTSSPASLSFGLMKWPHNGPITKTLTYRNDGEAALELDVTVPAPYTVDTTKITVPAHGTASVNVTLTPGAEGEFTGRVVASGAGASLSTAIGGQVEGERYSLKITTVGRAGNVPQLSTGVLVNAATGSGAGSIFGFNQGEFAYRLPPGTYDVQAALADPYAGNISGARSIVAKVGLKLDKDTSLSLDARTASPVTSAVQGVRTTSESNDFGVSVGKSGITYVADPTAPLYATPTGRITDRVYTFHLSPALVAGADLWRPIFWDEHGIPGKLDFVAGQREFAKVRADYAADVPGAVGSRGVYGSFPRSSGTIVPLRSTTLPLRRNEYFHASKDIVWSNTMYLMQTQPVYRYEVETMLRRTFDRRTYDVRWNRAPVSPATGPVGLGWGAQRKAGKLDVYIPLFSTAGKDTYRQSQNAMLKASTTLSKDGKVIGSSAYPGWGSFAAPDAGTYEIRSQATRELPWTTLGTSAEAVWTVADKLVDGPLPLLVVRTSADQEARAGRVHCLKVEVQKPAGSRITRLGVEVSFDDGKTWRRVPVVAGHALILHPAAPGFVSVRSEARDQAGNSVSQTVLRSYSFR